MDLKQKLIETTSKYITENKKWYSFIWGMGKDGRDRAEEFLRTLNATELSGDSLFNHVFNIIICQTGSSKNLRVRVARVLSEYLRLSDVVINDKRDEIYIKSNKLRGTVVKSSETIEAEAIIEVIKDTIQQQGSIERVNQRLLTRSL